MIGAKVIKPGGAAPTDFEKSIGQALLELESNSELKPQLRDLHVTRAREFEINNKTVCVSFDMMLNIRSFFVHCQ